MQSKFMSQFMFLVMSFLTFFTLMADAGAQSRTWSQPDYMIDPSAEFNFSVEAEDNFIDWSSYRDPEFEIALQLASPLEDSRFDSYNVIVIVNKYDLPDEPGQTMRVYHREYGLLYFWKVSTARAGKTTPDGYFRTQGFSSRHRSSLYQNSHMPWAVFFNGHIAAHGTFEPNISMLGRKASAGCVRIEPQRAEELFHIIGHSEVGYVDRIGPMGQIVFQNGAIIQDRAYRTLFIVKSGIHY